MEISKRNGLSQPPMSLRGGYPFRVLVEHREP